MKRSLLYIFIFSLSLFSNAQNAEFIVEEFDYDNGSYATLGKANSDGWSDAWTPAEEGKQINVNNGVGDIINGIFNRSFSKPITDDGGTLYIYTKLKNNMGLASSFSGLSFFAGESESLFMGEGWWNTTHAINQPNVMSDISTTEEMRYLIVIKMSGNTDNETVYVFFNPDENVAIDIEKADGTGQHFDLETTPWNSFSFRCGYEEDKQLYCDFIRIGTDVSKVFPAGIATGIAGKSLTKQIQVYPNPGKNYFTFNSIKPNARVKVHSIAGKLVYDNEQFNVNQKVNTKGWTSGVYLVNVTDEDGTATVKFIKE